MTTLSDIEEALGYGRFKSYSNYLVCFCPFHDNRNSPALFVYEQDYYCKSCGAYGSLNHLLAKLKHTPQYEMVSGTYQEFPLWKQWTNREGSLTLLAEKAHNNVEEYPSLGSYLVKQRKIGEAIEPLALGWYDRWVTIPVYDYQETLVDLVVRATDKLHTDIRYAVTPKDYWEASRLRPLYAPSWKRVEEADRVWIVYGMFDAVTLYLAGEAVITGIAGKTINPLLLKDIRKSMYIIPDFHEEVDAYRLARQLDWRGHVHKVVWPEGCKDLNDVLMKHGLGAVKALI